jgi:hypothetical protein
VKEAAEGWAAGLPWRHHRVLFVMSRLAVASPQASTVARTIGLTRPPPSHRPARASRTITSAPPMSSTRNSGTEGAWLQSEVRCRLDPSFVVRVDALVAVPTCARQVQGVERTNKDVRRKAAGRFLSGCDKLVRDG